MRPMRRTTKEPSFFADPKRLIQTMLIVVVLIGAIYFLLPSIVGLDDAVSKLKKADWLWITVALVFNVLAFASYVALFRGVVGERTLHLEWSESYQITMAGLAATRLFSAGGAGGIVLTYWALRKAGMPRRQSACRMVAFLVLLYAVYLLAVIIDGILLESGVLHGRDPVALTIIPAAVAGVRDPGLPRLIALVPEDLERRFSSERQGRAGQAMRKLSTVPATLASGTRTAIDFVRNPSRGGLAMAGAVGFWAANIGILWASFHAFDVHIPLGVVDPGLLHRHGRQPDPVRPGRRRRGRRGPDRHVRPLRPAGQRGLRGGAGLPADRLLAADPARDRRLLPAPPDGRPLGGGAGQVAARPRPSPILQKVKYHPL